jgi:hypothetical protein
LTGNEISDGKGIEMKDAPFTLYRVTNVISEESSKRGDYESSEATEPTGADFRETLDALNSDCWDNIDQRGDGTIICYPADYSQDIQTGDYEADTLIIKARRSEWADRLLSFYRAARIADAKHSRRLLRRYS